MNSWIGNTKIALIIIVLCGIFVFGACVNQANKTDTNRSKLAVSEEKNSVKAIDKHLLVGSWEDTSAAALHFTMFEDGTARSDNMRTLLYKKWSVEGDQVTFTVESIGNGTSFTEENTYTIKELTNNRLILKKGEYLFKYIRQQ